MIPNDTCLKAQLKRSTCGGSSHSSCCIEVETSRNSFSGSTNKFETTTLETLQVTPVPVKISEDDASINFDSMFQYKIIDKRQYKYHTKQRISEASCIGKDRETRLFLIYRITN